MGELALCGVIATSLACAITDLKWRKIFNVVTAPSLVFGLAFNIAQNGWSGILLGLSGVFAALIVFGVIYVKQVIGAGDVKLLMAVGAWMGAEFTLNVAVGSIVFGAVLAIAQLIREKKLADFFRRIQLWLTFFFFKKMKNQTDFRPQFDSDSQIPFGIPIALSVLLNICVDSPLQYLGISLW
jgi:prepilin peptidase CpaA